MDYELKMLKVDMDKYIICLDSKLNGADDGMKEKQIVANTLISSLKSAGIKNVAVLPFTIKTERLWVKVWIKLKLGITH